MRFPSHDVEAAVSLDDFRILALVGVFVFLAHDRGNVEEAVVDGRSVLADIFTYVRILFPRNHGIVHPGVAHTGRVAAPAIVELHALQALLLERDVDLLDRHVRRHHEQVVTFGLHREDLADVEGHLASLDLIELLGTPVHDTCLARRDQVFIGELGACHLAKVAHQLAVDQLGSWTVRHVFLREVTFLAVDFDLHVLAQRDLEIVRDGRGDATPPGTGVQLLGLCRCSWRLLSLYDTRDERGREQQQSCNHRNE